MEYTAAEKRLFEYFGLDLYITPGSRTYPSEVYQIAVEKAFLDNDQSKYASALRAVYRALDNYSLDLHTPELDSLILSELDNPNG